MIGLATSEDLDEVEKEFDKLNGRVAELEQTLTQLIKELKEKKEK